MRRLARLRAAQPKPLRFTQDVQLSRSPLYYQERPKSRKTTEQRFQSRMRPRGGKCLEPEWRASGRVVAQLDEEDDAEFQFWRTPPSRFEGDLQGRKLYGVGHRPKPQCVIGNFNAYGKEGPAASRVRAPDVVVYRPTGSAGQRVFGVFLVDSFYYFKKSKGAKKEYMEEMLSELWQQTGKVFMAVCSGGASLAVPVEPAAATYSELLAHVPAGVEAIIAVVCGNDFLASKWSTPARKRECWSA